MQVHVHRLTNDGCGTIAQQAGKPEIANDFRQAKRVIRVASRVKIRSGVILHHRFQPRIIHRAVVRFQVCKVHLGSCNQGLEFKLRPTGFADDFSAMFALLNVFQIVIQQRFVDIANNHRLEHCFFRTVETLFHCIPEKPSVKISRY